ncbi:LysR family transcriptional regulator [Epibacterium sp. SM1969]|uniref:LysR family transcriptional regulator n=1 Tax=Tritonibacter aquimaris TaxID=2663379 RepID=A0A844AN87_9RHOB|nr:LysR substrate-binding domain-containing protein [Tritonibacter aquimaris]MQY43990.1 LysR family transcriptional regulator [Tritonibacter aquimaris]
MNIKQMHYFVAVAEELHFGRAAERLDMAQPPLSRQIKQIEEDIGAQLFNRGRNAISLTQAGARLYERLQTILTDIDDTLLEVKRLGQGAEGRLRIGFVGSSTYGLVPNIIKSFRKNYPHVNLSLIPMNNANLHRALIRREVDVAITRPALRDVEFISRDLSQEPLVAAVPDALPLERSNGISGAEIAAQNVILYPEFPRPSYADFVLQNFETQGIELPKRVFTMDLQTALSLVSIGEGVCIVPASVANAQRNGIRFLNINLPLDKTSLSINHRIDESGIHIKNFISLAQTVARKTI